jgi:hypothetical protein
MRTAQVQQWTYYGRLDDAARPVEPLLATVLSLGAALPRHNPRILPSAMAGAFCVNQPFAVLGEVHPVPARVF